MKKLFLLLFALFITANVFAYDDTPIVGADHIYGQYYFGIPPNPSGTRYYYGARTTSDGGDIYCVNYTQIDTDSAIYTYFSSQGYLNSTHPGVPTPSILQPEYVVRTLIWTINGARKRFAPDGWYKYTYGSATGYDGRTWQYDEVWEDGNYSNGTRVYGDYQVQSGASWVTYQADAYIYLGYCL